MWCTNMRLMFTGCVIKEIAPLRVPNVSRVIFECREGVVEAEFHRKVMGEMTVGAQAELSITDSKEECLTYYFCGQGHVVSNNKVGEKYRAIISLHGFLVVVKTDDQLPLSPMGKVYFACNLQASHK